MSTYRCQAVITFGSGCKMWKLQFSETGNGIVAAPFILADTSYSNSHAPDHFDCLYIPKLDSSKKACQL